MTKTRAALLTVLALALLKSPLTRAMSALLPDVAVTPVPHLLTVMLLSLVLFGGGGWLLQPWDRTRLPQGKHPLQGVLPGVAGALLCRGAMEPVNTAWQVLTGLQAEMLPVPEGWLEAALYLLALVIVPAVAEEFFFRGALLSALTVRASRAGAILLSMLLFALLHGLANLPGMLAVGLLTALLMTSAGYLMAPVAAHLAFNMTALCWPELPVVGAVLCACGLCGVMAWLAVRQPRFARQHLPGVEMSIAAAAAAAAVLPVLCAG